MNRNTLLFSLGAALFAGVAFFFVYQLNAEGDDAGSAQDGKRPATPVVVAQAREREFLDILEALGTVKANESVEITATVEDRIAEIHFDDGDRVEADQVLVSLESGEEQSLLAEARAVLAERERQYERARQLFQRRATSKAALDEEERLLQTAKARVDNMEARVRDYTIRAPFSGVLGLRQVSEGAVVKTGTLITTLDDIARVKADFSVPEKFVGALTPGLTVAARAAAYPDRTFEGRVSTVSSRIDPITRSVIVRAMVDNADLSLKPGMLLTVEVVKRSSRALAVPEEAVLMEGNRGYVLAVDAADTVERRAIETGRREPGLVEVLDGLSPGDRVIVEGTNRVRPGATVAVVDAPDASGA
ncbi:MAG: efflux RND transporter periplasmic adaptor subunit [Desulfococcaceae bacterium]